MMNSEDVIGGIPYTIVKKRNIKNLYVRVNPPKGLVVVTAPIDYPNEEIKMYVIKKLPEITKVRERMISQIRQSKREYVSGESHYLWGKVYRLQVVSETNKYSVIKTPKKLVFNVPKSATTESKERAFNDWYREELSRVLDGVVERCEQRSGINANEYKIKNMRTKWGTCNNDNKRIWINLQLVKKPIECLEYVITHELVHLVEKNHTNRFRTLVEKFYPTWKDAKKILDDMPLDYLE